MEQHIEFTLEPIRIPAAPAGLRETGAVIEFHGVVRATEQGSAIAGLEYEAHVPMARVHLGRMLDELSNAWPCHAIWFIHRLGWVPAGEASLYIRVHSMRRDAAFRLCAELIDRMKRDAPIWKLTPAGAAAAASPPG